MENTTGVLKKGDRIRVAHKSAIPVHAWPVGTFGVVQSVNGTTVWFWPDGKPSTGSTKLDCVERIHGNKRRERATNV